MPPDIAAPDVAVTAARAELDRLWARGTAFLGCPVAIMGGAMSWVSERHLVAAISNAGGFGVIACGAMGPDLLAAEIAGTQALTGRPFGVNLITLHPQLDDLIRVCLAARVGHIGVYRDTATLAAVEYYCKLPADIAERLTVVVDPMLPWFGKKTSTGRAAESEVGMSAPIPRPSPVRFAAISGVLLFVRSRRPLRGTKAIRTSWCRS